MINMLTKIKSLLIILVLTLLLPVVSPSSVLAETPGLKATSFDVSVKPEYDDPRTLVIYEGNFVNSGTAVIKKDTPISFIIVKDAEIGMACELNAQGGHECQPYTTKDLADNKVELSWKITKDLQPNQKYPVFLEFYYDNKATAPNKTFDYTFTPTYNLDSLKLTITAPKTATNFTISPSASTTQTDQEQLKNYVFNYSNKTPNDPVTFKISYTKNDNKPSFDKPQTGNADATASKKSTSSLNNPALLIGMLVFVGLLVVLLVYSLKKSGKPPVPPKGTSHKNQSSHKNTNTNINANKNQDSIADKKKKIRQMLLDGKISEETYKELLQDLKNE
ncbi:hypothetical protein [Desulfitobacterium sp.]|uniref:hypothetical protein n=1 Tax=Desulfitobacterium sp. TaxID=49981 RepID=UPI002D17818B|nr:hypothetical protein [Desulfitobacterium sp.]HVJ47692.1 hypothetical protein [Desulfitobacterium sp.]